MAKSLSWESTWDPVNAFRSVDFPAFVYPTMAAVFRLPRLLPVRKSSRWRSTWESSSFRAVILLRIRRRSVSSFFSPGPLVPIPPPSLDKEARRPTRRALLYRSCANSTWILPSLVVACFAKISRIRSVLSITLHSSSCSRLFICAGESSSSQIMPVASTASIRERTSSIFPFPIYVPG